METWPSQIHLSQPQFPLSVKWRKIILRPRIWACLFVWGSGDGGTSGEDLSNIVSLNLPKYPKRKVILFPPFPAELMGSGTLNNLPKVIQEVNNRAEI